MSPKKMSLIAKEGKKESFWRVCLNIEQREKIRRECWTTTKNLNPYLFIYFFFFLKTEDLKKLGKSGKNREECDIVLSDSDIKSGSIPE